MQTETEEQVDVDTCWPPLAHLYDGRQGLKEGTLALCGAKLMGIPLPNTSKTCKECEEIYAQLFGL